MKDNTCNGWSNYETWNCYNDMQNHESSYTSAYQKTKQAYQLENVKFLERYLDKFYGGNNKINTKEIANSLYEDYKLFKESCND